MFDAVHGQVTVDAHPAMQRVKGVARIAFKHERGKTCLDDLFQSGSGKFRLPRVYDGVPVAVLINTAGGITGGDALSYEAGVGRGGHAVVTSQAAERAYRRSFGIGQVQTKLSAGEGATIEWLPQETILFNSSALHRRLTVDLAEDARLMALESVVLGRSAMGEQLDAVSFRDSWRIRRGGRLSYADDVRIEGDPRDILKGAATTEGGIAFATFLDCCPHAEDRLPLAREALAARADDTSVRAAASAWNGVLVTRFVATDGRALRECLISFLETYRSAALPRVWHC